MAYAYGRHSLKNCKCKKEKGTKLLMGFEFAISSILSLWQNGFSPGMMCPEQSTHYQACVTNNQHITSNVSQTINTSPGLHQDSNLMKDQE
jgi:hypothetical protein